MIAKTMMPETDRSCAPGRAVRPRRPHDRGRWMAIVAAVLVVFVVGCSTEPGPILYGSQECEQCRMIVSDPRFATQAVTSKGRAYVFDTIECLAEWVAALPDAESGLRAMWAADYGEPENWVPVEEGWFVRSGELHSPMGLGLSAHPDRSAAEEHRTRHGGDVLRWAEVIDLVGREGANARHGHEHG